MIISKSKKLYVEGNPEGLTIIWIPPQLDKGIMDVVSAAVNSDKFSLLKRALASDPIQFDMPSGDFSISGHKESLNLKFSLIIPPVEHNLDLSSTESAILITTLMSIVE